MNITSRLAAAISFAGHTPTTPKPLAAEVDAQSRRADLAAAAAEKQEEIERLQQELDKAQDAAGGAWQGLRSFFGDDGGAGDMRTVKHPEHAPTASYAHTIKDAAQAREERDSFQNLFGTIFGGPLIGTHVGAADAKPEADHRSDPSQHQTHLVSSRAESSRWRDALTKEP